MSNPVTSTSGSYDTIIIGGGPAGLSAALILGRCRRTVLVCDHGRYRNRWSRALHGFLSRDGTPPLELLRSAREQLTQYKTVEVRQVRVENVQCIDGGFNVQLDDGRPALKSRKLLLATGVIDELPDIPGLIDVYGRGAFHCPYCDAWEQRDKRIGVIGSGEQGWKKCLTLTIWSSSLILFANGPAELSQKQLDELSARGVSVHQERISKIESQLGVLTGVKLNDGRLVECDALFIHPHQVQGSPFPAQLGCEDRERRSVPTGDFESTEVYGLYVAGDASRDTQLAIVAAAEGANAAFAINRELLKEDLAESRSAS